MSELDEFRRKLRVIRLITFPFLILLGILYPAPLRSGSLCRMGKLEWLEPLTRPRRKLCAQL